MQGTRHLVAGLVAGVLLGVAALAIAILLVRADAPARAAGTWQVYDSTDETGVSINDVDPELVQEFVAALPAECDIETTASPLIIYYRCP
jgi:hypothetical protein